MKYLVLSLLLIFNACENADEYLHYDNPPRIEKIEDEYQVRNILRDARIDILFVVDNSGSMSDIQQNIIRNSGLFMQNFIQSNFMKWRMGVVSTDKDQDPFLGFVPYFDNNSPNQVSTFQTAIGNLGINGSPSEYVFFNIMRMMTDLRFTHFFRPQAHLAVIMVSDEKEQSEEQFGPQYEPLTFLNQIRSMKDPEKIIRFYGALSLPDLEGCRNFDEPYADSPYEKIIDATGGIIMSACTPDFGAKLAEIGKDIISIIDSPSILLKERPDIETLEVYYDDLLLPAGKKEDGGLWYYSKKYNTVNFYDLDFMPDFQKSKITIKYDIADGVDRSED